MDSSGHEEAALGREGAGQTWTRLSRAGARARGPGHSPERAEAGRRAVLTCPAGH